MTTTTRTAVLKIAVATYPHTKGLKDGTVTAPGIQFEHIEISPIIAAFRRMCRALLMTCEHMTSRSRRG